MSTITSDESRTYGRQGSESSLLEAADDSCSDTRRRIDCTRTISYRVNFGISTRGSVTRDLPMSTNFENHHPTRWDWTPTADQIDRGSADQPFWRCAVGGWGLVRWTRVHNHVKKKASPCRFCDCIRLGGVKAASWSTVQMVRRVQSDANFGYMGGVRVTLHRPSAPRVLARVCVGELLLPSTIFFWGMPNASRDALDSRINSSIGFVQFEDSSVVRVRAGWASCLLVDISIVLAQNA